MRLVHEPHPDDVPQPWPELRKRLHMVVFKYYVDRRGWVGGQANVYAYKANDLFLFTLFVYKGWVGGPKSQKICPHSF